MRLTDGQHALRPIHVLVFSIAIGPVFPAFAVGYYEWTDDAGVIHLTDDPAKIPARSGRSAQSQRSAGVVAGVSALEEMRPVPR